MSAKYEKPKKMVHPAFKKGTTTAIPGTDAVTGRKFTDHQGVPDRFPPVMVEYLEQELQHRAQGYTEEGEVPPAQSYNRYPMWLNKPDSDPVLVNSAEEEQGRLKQGYIAPGVADAKAAEAAIANPHIPGRVVSEFPKMVDGKVVDIKRGEEVTSSGYAKFPMWHEGVLVNSQAEMDSRFPSKQEAKPSRIKA